MTITNYADLKALADEVEKLDKARTQGEWLTDKPNKHGGNCIYSETKRRVKTTKRIVANVPFEQNQEIPDANMAFIAKAPSMAAALQFAVQRLEVMEAALQKIADTEKMSYTELEKLPYNWDIAKQALQPVGDK